MCTDTWQDVSPLEPLQVPKIVFHEFLTVALVTGHVVAQLLVFT